MRVLGVGVALNACFIGEIVEPGAEDRLEHARELWAASQAGAYRFDYHLSNCECLPADAGPARVVVAGGRVVSVLPLPGGSAEVTDGTFPTIEDLFALIAGGIAEGYHVLDVTYDPTLGYPTRIEIDQDVATVDDESLHTVSNVETG